MNKQKLSEKQRAALKVIINRKPEDPAIKKRVHKNTIYSLIRNNIVQLDIFGCYSLVEGNKQD